MSFSKDCIKSVTCTKTQSGINLSITKISDNNNIPESITVGNYELKLKSIKNNKYLTTLTYGTEFNTLLIGSSYFIVLHKNIYKALTDYKQLQNFFLSTLGTDYTRTSINIKISEKEDDYYVEETGFYPSDIFSAYNVNITYPSAIKYKISKLMIPNNTTIISLIKTIFPFPITINFIKENVINIEIDNSQIKQLISSNDYCITNKSSKNIKFNTVVFGLPSRPKTNILEKEGVGDENSYTIDVETGKMISNGSNSNETVEYFFKYNIFKKIYTINREITTIKSYVYPDNLNDTENNCKE